MSASWVKDEHKVAQILVTKYYTEPVAEYEGWKLVTKTHRVGVYKKGDQYIVISKGTTLTDPKDIFDDARIGGFMGGEITIDKETETLTRALIAKGVKKKDILQAGHSLGGRAALVVAKELGTKAVAFNPAAPWIKPLTQGPGPENATTYHIVGDLISSHVSPTASEVIRVDQGYNPFQTVDAHKMANFTPQAKVYGFSSADQEDAHLYSNLAIVSASLVDYKSMQNILRTTNKITLSPIPGSKRFKKPHDRLSLLNTPYGILYTMGKAYTADSNIRIIQQELGFKQTGLGLKNKVFEAGKLFNLGVDISENLLSIGTNLRDFRLINVTGDTIKLDALLKDFNETAHDIMGGKLKESEVLFSSSKPLSATELLDAADLQMIGIEDEAITKIQYSATVDEPAKYLDNVADTINDHPSNLTKIHAERLEWVHNPAYESKAGKWKSNPIYEPKSISAERTTGKWKNNPIYESKWKSNPIYEPKSLSSIKAASRTSLKTGKSILVTTIRSYGKLAVEVGAKVFSKIIPVLAAADLGYTTYLLVKGIAKNDYSEVVEHVTGVSLDTWKENVQLVKKGPVEYWRGFFEGIRPSCERCPPGGPLTWNGISCVYNPCEKRNGVWGVYDFRTQTCSYQQLAQPINPLAIDLTKPGDTKAPVMQNSTVTENTAQEQQAAMTDFKAKAAEYDKWTLYQPGETEITLGTKRAYRAAYDWSNICPKNV